MIDGINPKLEKLAEEPYVKIRGYDAGVEGGGFRPKQI